MTLDEAIKHCEEKAEELRRWSAISRNGSAEEADCLECAREHEQLAEWLKDYKQLKEQRPQGEWIEHTEKITLDTYYECSNCKEPWTTIEGTPWQNMMNFCPNCGASMKPKTCTNCETFGEGCEDCEVNDDD